MSKIVYNKTEVFQNEAQPLLEQLKAVCSRHDLPIACTIAYAAEDIDENTIRHAVTAISGGDPNLMPDSMKTLIDLSRGKLFDVGMGIVNEAFTMMKASLGLAECMEEAGSN